MRCLGCGGGGCNQEKIFHNNGISKLKQVWSKQLFFVDIYLFFETKQIQQWREGYTNKEIDLLETKLFRYRVEYIKKYSVVDNRNIDIKSL